MRHASAMLVLCLLPLWGCLSENYVKEDRVDRRVKTLKLTHHVGGTQECLLVRDGVWYVGFGPQLLVLEGRGGKPLRSERVRPDGEGGAITDLAFWHGDLVAVVDGDAVVRWDIASPRTPVLIDSVSAQDLGIRPRSLRVVDGTLYVSGDGGVVRSSDGAKFLAGGATVGRVVQTASGPAAPVGRRVQRLEDDSFLGAASMLEPLPASAGLPGGFAFALQGKEGATVGLMNAQLREVVGESIRGTLRRLVIANGRLWAIFDTEIASWDLKGGKLESPVYTAVKGARDLAPLSENLYAVTGSFGRGVYHLHDDKDGAGDSFTDAVREPGRLEQSLFDGRRVLAGSYEGFWLYPIRGKPTISEKAVTLSTIPDTKITLPWAEAEIDKGGPGVEAGRKILLRASGAETEWELPPHVYACVLAAVDGDLWIGHTDGITVLRPGGAVDAPAKGAADAPGKAGGALAYSKRGELRLPGPVLWIHPLRTGLGAVWVTHFGGLGVAEFTPDESAPPAR